MLDWSRGKAAGRLQPALRHLPAPMHSIQALCSQESCDSQSLELVSRGVNLLLVTIKG